jgi:hypothetical protein
LAPVEEPRLPDPEQPLELAVGLFESPRLKQRGAARRPPVLLELAEHGERQLGALLAMVPLPGVEAGGRAVGAHQARLAEVVAAGGRLLARTALALRGRGGRGGGGHRRSCGDVTRRQSRGGGGVRWNSEFCEQERIRMAALDLEWTDRRSRPPIADQMKP